ncbi:MAG: hypothetical protein ACT4PM_15205, partial [Gemmatimonadales bacterium]
MPGYEPRALVLAALPLLLVATSLVPSENPRLRRLVERGRHPAIRWGRFSDVQGEARRVYAGNGWAPLWLESPGQRPTREARAVLDLLATVGDRGLDPQDYDAAQLAAMAANLDRGGADAEQAIRFDTGLTIGLLRASRALAGGRVRPPAGVGGTGRVQSNGFDPVPIVDSLRRGADPGAVLLALEPDWSPYQDLRHALGRYRRFAKDSAARRPWYQVRIRQIELALERWRWVPRVPEGGGDLLLVQVPAQRIVLTRRSGQPPVAMSVRVGERCRRLEAFGAGLWMLAFRPSGSSAAVKFPLAGEVALEGESPNPRLVAPAPAGPGCVRVADGELLAELLLRDRPEW